MALALLVTIPLLAPGFVLSYDMVFVPRLPFSSALLGISRLPARTVPSDLGVAVLSRALSGQVVEKLALVGIFLLGMLGAARLIPSARPAARVGAGVLYVWNPFLYERLLLGHWALLLGYALLPWVARAAVEVREGRDRAGWRLFLAVTAAGVASPYTGVAAVLLAAPILVFPPWPEGGRRVRSNIFLVGGIAVASNLPWLIPSLLRPPQPGPASLGLAAFRARADSPLGLIGSLLSLGGLWRTDLAPPGRAGWWWIPAFALILAFVILGWMALRRRWPAGVSWGLLAAGLLGFFLAAAPSLPGARPAVLWMIRTLPGGAMFRDSQKFVMLLAPGLAVGFGLGIEVALGALASRATSSRRWSGLAAVALPILPVALAPSLAWGAAGRLSTAGYPPSWTAAQRTMSADPVPGAVLALPWHAYLPFIWNHGRVVHQPALEYFTRPVVASSALELGQATIPDEDPWSALAGPVVLNDGPLEAYLPSLGVRYVLLFKEADWPAFRPRTAGLVPVLDTGDLVLYRGPPPTRVPSFPRPPAIPVLAADAVFAVLVAVAALQVRRRRLGSPALTAKLPQSKNPPSTRAHKGGSV